MVVIIAGVWLTMSYFPSGQYMSPGASNTGEDQGFVVQYTLPASRVVGTRPDKIQREECSVTYLMDIVYDDTRILNHVAALLSGDTICGCAKYSVVTPNGIVEFTGSLDKLYLGSKFDAEDLLAFLKLRLDGKTVEREFRIKNPKLAEAYRERIKKGKRFTARLSYSPWDKDVASAMSLLSQAQHSSARETFVRLTEDSTAHIRYTAVHGLGQLAPKDPRAVNDLVQLLSNKELRRLAAEAMGQAGKVAVPALIKALDHPDEVTRNHVIFGIARADNTVSIPVLNVGLRSKDSSMRLWATNVIVDMLGRGVRIENKDIMARLTDLLSDQDSDTRRCAKIALTCFSKAEQGATADAKRQRR